MAHSSQGDEDGTRADHEEELFRRLEQRLKSVGVLTDSRRMQGPAERSMLRTLATRDRPLAEPDEFARAHRGLARGLESLMMNAREMPVLPRRMGPLSGVAMPLVQLVANWIQSTQIRAVLRDVRRLYALREANSVWQSPEHLVLRRARAQLQIISEVSVSSVGLPVFLLSGAFLSAAVGVVRGIVGPALSDRTATTVLLVIGVLALVLIAAAFLLGASVAKMRLRLALEAPLAALYRAIGSTGPQPSDRCFQVALIALGLFAVAVLAIPSGIFWLFQL